MFSLKAHRSELLFTVHDSEKGAQEILAEHLNVKMGMMLGDVFPMVVTGLLFFPLLELSFSKSSLLVVDFPSHKILSWCQVGSPAEGRGALADVEPGLCRNQEALWSAARMLHHRRAAALPSLATHKLSTFR